MPNEVMLLIAQPTGVFYQNQIGGSACMQMELEGAFAPIVLDQASHERIMGLFDPYGQQGISVGTADAIDSILSSQRGANGLRVDRRRLQESWEAWVYVTLDSASSIDAPWHADPWLGFGTADGVLTWPNSD